MRDGRPLRVSHARSNDAYSFVQANANVASTINGRNQLTVHAGASVTHDARGNLTSLGGTGWDYYAENRMAHASGEVGIVYDPLGRLYFTGAPAGSIWFLSDGGNIIAEYASGITLQRRFVHGAGQDEPLVWYEGSGTATRRWFHADERGSIGAISDSSGNGVGDLYGGRNRYDEYGVPASTNVGRFGYAGQIRLPEIGRYHYEALAADLSPNYDDGSRCRRPNLSHCGAAPAGPPRVFTRCLRFAAKPPLP